MSNLEWEALQLPINLAFFMFSTAAGRVVALYPSPAGATESLPSPDAWEAIVEQNPSLRDLQPDVEILLVNRLGEKSECFRVGVDVGYSLVGVVRKQWRGLSGGTEVWQEIDRFFMNLKQRAHPAESP